MTTPTPDHEHKFDLAVKAARKAYGPGWDLIGPQAQENAIAREMLHIFYIQDDRTPAEPVRALLVSMCDQLVARFNA